MRIKFFIIWLCSLFPYLGISQQIPKIAIISDAHIQDVMGHPETVRTMQVQVQSTRLFNENIFALKAALDDIARQHISLVIMTGDMTDDGQLLNQEAARRILDQYESQYGMQFFLTPGNHDPKVPFGMQMKGKDYLRADGGTLTIVSDSLQYAPLSKTPILVDTLMRSAGYPEELHCYAPYGYFPRREYLYWACPFSDNDYLHYQYERVLRQSQLSHRYRMVAGVRVIDPSYVVEPVKGLWLLSIDPGVYLPVQKEDGTVGFQNSSVGYNLLLSYKKGLLQWIRTVAAEAHRYGKTLIAFSHYPLVDYNDGATPVIKAAWGRHVFDVDRVPSEAVTDSLLQAGIRLHFAGHMHVNDTGIFHDKDGNSLYNIQTPSLATGMPAYKTVQVLPGNRFHIQTILLDSVPGFNSLFPRYAKEFQYEQQHEGKVIWSKEALKSKNYQEFCDWQLQDLTRNRFVPRDIPRLLRERLLTLQGKGFSGMEMVTDLYRLYYSSGLARLRIPIRRIKAYGRYFKQLERQKNPDAFTREMQSFAQIFQCFLQGEPDVDFTIDLNHDTIYDHETK